MNIFTPFVRSNFYIFCCCFSGKLGLKITGDSSGIYIDDFDETVRMEGNRIKKGDRLVAVNGRSLENVSYANAIDLIKKSGDSVHFLVSQLKDQ